MHPVLLPGVAARTRSWRTPALAPVEFLWQAVGGPDGLQGPNAAAIGADGTLIVSGIEGNGFTLIDPDTGAFLGTWGARGSGEGEFDFEIRAGEDYDSGIVADADGALYVADTANRRVQAFDRGLAFVAAWGTLGCGDGQFVRPAGIAIDGSGNVVVCDAARSDCQTFAPDGTFVRSFGDAGPGRLRQPGHPATDSDGNVHVPDYGRNRIVVFAPDGSFRAAYGESGTEIGQFSVPNDVAVDAAGTISVADLENHRIQVLDPVGRPLAAWGEEGSGEGQFRYPAGVVLDGAGNIYVMDIGNNRVQKFRLPVLPDAAAAPDR